MAKVSFYIDKHDAKKAAFHTFLSALRTQQPVTFHVHSRKNHQRVLSDPREVVEVQAEWHPLTPLDEAFEGVKETIRLFDLCEEP